MTTMGRALGLGWGLLVAMTVAQAAVVTWTGAGDGRNWALGGNWEGGRVPGPADDAVIPVVFAQVEHPGGVTVIRSLTAPGGFRLRGGTLRLTAGESRVGGIFELAEGATIEGVGTTVVLEVDGAPVEWMGELRAEGGAKMRLTNVVRLRGSGLEWFADGAGTVIEAAGVTNVVLNTSASFAIRARNGARVVLTGWKAARGPIQVDARMEAEVDLSGLEGRWTSVGYSQRAVLTALEGGRIRMPGVTELDAASISVDAAGAIETGQWRGLTSCALNLVGAELDVGSLTSVDDSDIRVSDGGVLRLPKVRELRGESSYWWAEGPGTVVDAGGMTNLPLATSSSFVVQARNQARVVLSGLRNSPGALVADARGGASIDLSGVSGIWTSGGSSQRGGIIAIEEGRVLLPGLVALERLNVSLDARGAVETGGWTSFRESQLNLEGAELDLSSLTNVNGSDFRLSAGAVIRLPRVVEIRGDSPYWFVEGQGTVLDAGAVTQLALSSSDLLSIQARDQGRVLLSGLPTVRGALLADARGGAEVDLSGLRGRWTSVGSSQRGGVLAVEGGRVRMDGIRELDRLNVTADSAAGMDMSGWVSVTDCQVNLSAGAWNLASLTNVNGCDLRLSDGAVLRLPSVRAIRGDSTYWLVDGPGVVLDARFAMQVDLISAAVFAIQARNQARVDLSGLEALSGAIQPDARSGAVIDLSGAKGTWRRARSSNLPLVYVASDGRVLMPGITAIESGNLTVHDTGRMDTDQLERVVDSVVIADGSEAVLSFGSLRDQTGTTFRQQNGGRIVYASAPRILAGPVGKRVAIGETVILRVDAQGEPPLRYQWYKNGQPMPGEIHASLLLTSVQVEDAASYQVFVGNPAGLTPSEPALVSLALSPLPFDDAFARRGLVTSTEGAGLGNNATATLEPGEPRHADKQGGRSIWLSWRPNVSGVVSFRTTGSAFDTVLAVYRGGALAAMGASRVAADDDAGGYLTSEVRFNAEAGVTYQIAVDGFAGVGGDVVLSWRLVEFSVTSPTLPEFTRQPEGAVAVVGTTVTLSAEVDPGDALLQWFKNDVPLAGETGSLLILPNVQPLQAGAYRVVATTALGGTRASAPARLEVADRPESATGFSADKLEDLFGPGEGGGSGLALHAAGATGGGIGVGLPGGRWTDTRGSTRSPGDPVVCDVETTATRWFRLRLNVPAVQAFTLHTEGSEVPAFLAVFTNRAALKLVGCDAAAAPQKPAARVVFPARSGVDYLVLVDGVSGAQGRIQLNWNLEDTEVPTRRPELKLESGRLTIQMFPLPGIYDWQAGSALGVMQTLFRTNLTAGQFRFVDPEPASAPARFFHLKPVRP